MKMDMVGCLLGWVSRHIKLCSLFNANPIFIQIIRFISNNSVYHDQTDQLSKTFLFQATQFSQTVLIEIIQFSISIGFVYTQSNVKTILFQTIQFSVSTVSLSKTVLLQTIQFCISTQFSSI